MNNHTTMRVYITEKCNAKCKTCFNASSRSESEMTLSDFNRLCQYLSENGITTLKIMGGEPTIHNEFEKIVSSAQEYFETISIFTNGLNNRIKNIKLRDNDSIVFNFSFNKTLNENNLFFENGGKRNLEIQVHKETDEKALLNRILEIASINKEKTHISLTLDCTSNIFIEKPYIIPKLRYIEDGLTKREFSFGYDHKMPACYLYNTGLHPSSLGMCNFHSSGLIGADLKLRFCNQYSEKILEIYQNDRFLPWNIVRNHLLNAYYKLQVKALDKICSNCIFFGSKCNGGCWISNDRITRKDIISNSDFPTK